MNDIIGMIYFFSLAALVWCLLILLFRGSQPSLSLFWAGFQRVIVLGVLAVIVFLLIGPTMTETWGATVRDFVAIMAAVAGILAYVIRYFKLF